MNLELVEKLQDKKSVTKKPLFSELSSEIMQLINTKNALSLAESKVPLSGLGGSLAVHCSVDLRDKKILEAASMSTIFKSYESLLPGRELNEVGLVSSTASGLCGGVHATASALCLEMALGLKPPALGIVIRNLLLSCQYLNDNTMHLFVLAGPDYSQQIVEKTNPEIWNKAQYSNSQFADIHGYSKIADIMFELNKGQGMLYKEALKMVNIARQAYITLGGKYPDSDIIIPGGVTIDVDSEKLSEFKSILQAFSSYSQKTAAIWDDIFNFMLDANPCYEDLGRSSASMLDFGQWDHPDYYDSQYETCDLWGEKRWSTPAAIFDGKLACVRLSELNAGMEEYFNYSYQKPVPISESKIIQFDPNGNRISSHHPWNKCSQKPTAINSQAYSWGSSLTWHGHGFEVGAYSRLYLTAVAQKLPSSNYLTANGSSLEFSFPNQDSRETVMQWHVPNIWNAFERNRARAYALSFSYTVTLENIDIAQRLIDSGETETHSVENEFNSGRNLGVGLWGASRGFLAHWAIIEDRCIENYQIAVPSRVNAGTRTPQLELGPLEKALLNTPIIESNFSKPENFTAIDIQRTIQSFDPCMSCSSHVLIKNTNKVVSNEIDTCFPV